MDWALSLPHLPPSAPHPLNHPLPHAGTLLGVNPKQNPPFTHTHQLSPLPHTQTCLSCPRAPCPRLLQVLESKKGIKIDRATRDALSAGRRLRPADVLLRSDLGRCVDGAKLRDALSAGQRS
eukprot:365869-Chlamydomonas_euryale.AAC.10